jgi:hypothetical protein
MQGPPAVVALRRGSNPLQAYAFKATKLVVQSGANVDNTGDGAPFVAIKPQSGPRCS